MLKVGKTMQAVVALLDDTPRTARELANSLGLPSTKRSMDSMTSACEKLADYGFLVTSKAESHATSGPRWVKAWSIDHRANIPRCFRTAKGKTIGYAMVSILEALEMKGEVTTRWVAENLYATDRVRMMAIEDRPLFFEAVAWASTSLRRLEASGLIVGERSKDEYGRNKPTIWRRA